MVNQLDSQGQFWDAVSEHGGIVAEARVLIESLVPPDKIQGHDVLDAGCGAGDYSAALTQIGAGAVCGFDISLGSLSVAAKKAPEVPFLQGSLTDLPYRSAAFDIVWSWGVLHYVPNPAQALKEISRFLRPGGTMVIHTLRTGFWSSLELTSARLLNPAPKWVRELVLTTGETVVPPITRLMTGKHPEEHTTKSIRQKMTERFFVPGKLNTFSLPDLAAVLGSQMTLSEAHPPVADLLKRDMSITVIGKKA